jgi:hypothetical protein
MAAVVNAVVNVVENVVEAVGDAVETVVDVVENTVQAVVENPEILVIAVVAPQILPAIGIPAIAVQPITAGLISASQGGDIEDIGKAALGAYIAPQIAGKVGGAVAGSTAGSTLQNALSSAAGSAAGSAVGAAISGGDIGQAALLGAVGGAGASVGRELAAAAEYGTTPFSEQTQALVSQDAPVNRFSQIAADVGSGLARGAVSGNIEGELQNAVSGMATREVGNLLRDAFASSPQAQETQKAQEIIAAELDASPAFQEQIQLAQIANGNVPLSVDQQIDALAEALAREEFDVAAQENAIQTAALPAVALPIASAAARVAVQSAPQVVTKIARFAANDPRFAQVMVTNPYVQRLLAAAGVTVSVSLTGDTIVEPVAPADQSAAETARLNRYAADIQKQLPKTNTQQINKLESTARQAELSSTRDELRQLERQGFSVERELSRVEQELGRVSQPTFTPEFEPEVEPGFEPGTLPPTTTPEFEPLPEIEVQPPGRAPQIDIDVTPGTQPTPRPRPDTRPGDMPTERPEEEPGTETRPVTRPDTGARPGEEPAVEPVTDKEPASRTEPARTDRTRPDGRRPITPQPIDIDELFTDEEVLDLIRESFGEDYLEETQIEGAAEPGQGFPATVDIEMAGAPQRQGTRRSLTSRQVGQGMAAIVGDKDPTFGGDPGAQQDVWNVRSLRLRKALGL